jgi:hypothetical protein
MDDLRRHLLSPQVTEQQLTALASPPWSAGGGPLYCKPEGGCGKISNERAVKILSQPKRGLRIVWLGGSLLYGSGALRPEETFFARVHQALLSERSLAGKTIESFNLAGAGFNEDDPIDYKEYAPELAADLVLVNAVPLTLLQNRFSALLYNQQTGTPSLILLGPSDPEAPRPSMPGDFVANWRAGGSLAGLLPVRIIDLDGAFRSLGAREGGVTHWDDNHLTSYGHELVARLLEPVVVRALRDGHSCE